VFRPFATGTPQAAFGQRAGPTASSRRRRAVLTIWSMVGTHGPSPTVPDRSVLAGSGSDALILGSATSSLGNRGGTLCSSTGRSRVAAHTQGRSLIDGCRRSIARAVAVASRFARFRPQRSALSRSAGCDVSSRMPSGRARHRDRCLPPARTGDCRSSRYRRRLTHADPATSPHTQHVSR
jgi:hypothetical protein